MKTPIGRVAIATILILLIPFIAMQFTDEVKWDETDFMIMGILIFGTGLALDLVFKKAIKHRTIAVMTVMAIFLYIWTELAVGVFTNLGS